MAMNSGAPSTGAESADEMATEAKSSYHHGDLRTALLTHATDMLESGENFSMRALAKRAGVSNAAPGPGLRVAPGGAGVSGGDRRVPGPPGPARVAALSPLRSG